MPAADKARLIQEIRLMETRLALVKEELAQLRPDGGHWVDLLLFQVGPLALALNVLRIEEIVMTARLSLLPETPAWILGALNLYGDLVVVIDPLLRLLGQRGEHSADDKIIICHHQGQGLGLLVEDVDRVERVARRSIAPPLSDLSCREHVTGSLTIEARAYHVLDIERLIAEHREVGFG
jgi:purine-binding chemotaxis protein CheW